LDSFGAIYTPDTQAWISKSVCCMSKNCLEKEEDTIKQILERLRRNK